MEEKDPKILTKVEEQFKVLQRGTSEIVPADSLKNKLYNSIKNNKPLRVKLGCDPSKPDLHLGHTVVLEKLAAFQKFGHQVIFLIGDFTAQIGDPTGRSETRQNLTKAEVQENSRTYSNQVMKILNPSKTQIVFNSHWSDTLKIQDIIKLASQMTVARMLERDDFSKRYKDNQPIALHEFFYPILQANDSVQLRADVELGGTDQKFNVLMGREYQKHAGQAQQCVVLMPILEGTDGVQKMSKSLGNAIGITEKPEEIFGKVMSISDEMMFRYYELLTLEDLEEVKKLHPKKAKMALAFNIVQKFYTKPKAEKAQEAFEDMFKNKNVPEDIAELKAPSEEMLLVQLMVDQKLSASLSEARRLIKQGGVSMEGEKVADITTLVNSKTLGVLKVGKRKFLKLT